MDQNELKKAIKKERQNKKKLSSKDMKRAMKESNKLGNKYEFPNGTYKMVVAMEECNELSQEISKYIRGKGNKQHLTEEIADTLAGIEFMKYIAGISDEDVANVRQIKTKRMIERDNLTKKGKKK